MKMDRYLPPQHPLSKVYRVGAALFGIGLAAFGILGLANRLSYVSTEGKVILGLSSNGLLSVLSVLVGAILVGAAAKGGALASTTTAVIGVLFFLSGLLHLALLDTPLNLLAFKMQNVVFSLVAGMLLLFVGLYGRVSGGLPADNPYVRARHHEDPDADHSGELAAERQRLTEIEELSLAELAVAEGTATHEQEQLVRADARQRAEEARRLAYRLDRQSHRLRLPANTPWS